MQPRLTGDPQTVGPPIYPDLERRIDPLLVLEALSIIDEDGERGARRHESSNPQRIRLLRSDVKPRLARYQKLVLAEKERHLGERRFYVVVPGL